MMEVTTDVEASEADVVVFASGEASAAYVAKERGSASDACVPGALSDGRWDPIPIRITQSYDIQGSIDAAVGCPRCLERGLDINCIGSKQLNKHIFKEHPEMQVNWLCDQCGKSFPKIHAWRCHHIRCKGKSDNHQAMHKCESCPMKFDSKIGLSQHERHVHPDLRNIKRTAEASKPTEGAGRKLTIWTAEELEELERLDREFQGERNINVRLMEFFPGKTNKQISDARRRFRSPEPRSPTTYSEAEQQASPVRVEIGLGCHIART